MNEKLRIYQRTQNVLGIKGENISYDPHSTLKNYIKKSEKLNHTVKRKLNFEKTYSKEYDYMTNLISEYNEKENYNMNNIFNNSMINLKKNKNFDLTFHKKEGKKTILTNDIDMNKKILILELDETLIHTTFMEVPNCDYDFTFNINFLERPVKVYVYKRPYVNEFLYQMSKYYNIIIYSSNIPEYSNPLIDKLDEEKVILKRIYKDKRIELNGVLFTDLSKLIIENGSNIIIIINNSSPPFINNSNNNTLPMNSWHFNKSDDELIKLKGFLEFLSNVNDVREYIKGIAVKNVIDYERIENLLNNLKINKKQKEKYRKCYIDNDDRYLRNPSKEFNCGSLRKNYKKYSRRNSLSNNRMNKNVNNNNITLNDRNNIFDDFNNNNNFNYTNKYNNNNTNNKNVNNYIYNNNNIHLTFSTKKKIEEKILSKLKPNYYQYQNINYQNEERPFQETPKFSNIYK